MESGYLLCLWASARCEFTQSIRAYSSRWFVGLRIIPPVIYVLTSWTLLQIMSNTSSISFFTSLTGTAAYGSYVTLGFAFTSVIINSCFAGGTSVHSEQEGGTLEAVMGTPGRFTAWILGKMLAFQLISLVSFTVILLLGFVLFGVQIASSPDWLTTSIGLISTLIGMSAIGFVLAGFTLLFKKSEDLDYMLWPVLVFFGGLAFPTSILPTWAQAISYSLPITHGLNLVRAGLLSGLPVTTPGVASDIFPLVAEAVLLLLIGFFVLKIAAKRGKMTGTIYTY